MFILNMAKVLNNLQAVTVSQNLRLQTTYYYFLLWMMSVRANALNKDLPRTALAPPTHSSNLLFLKASQLEESWFKGKGNRGKMACFTILHYSSLESSSRIENLVLGMNTAGPV